MGGPDGKKFGSRSWRTNRAQRGRCAMTESQIYSHPARPNLVNKYHMTNLKTNVVEVLTREAVRFCSSPPPPPPSRNCVRPSYGTFINGFEKKALAGPYGSYDKCVTCGRGLINILIYNSRVRVRTVLSDL